MNRLRMTALALTVVAGPALASSPFFDDDPATKYAPFYHGTTAIDQDVLDICGGWGAPVEQARVEALLESQMEILDRVNEQPTTKKLSFGDWVAMWSEKDGFAHVFCGEVSSKKLGGLHFAPRLKQAQDEGWARMCSEGYECIRDYHEEVASQDVYGVPVWYQKPGSDKFKTKSILSYNRTMSADDILYEATLAFAHYSDQVSGKQSCIFSVQGGADYPDHSAVAAMTQTGLVTFYATGPKGVKHSIKKYGSASSCR